VTDVDYPLAPKVAASFNLVVCAKCGEAVAENKARLLDGKPICLPCSRYGV
jgi:formylmethanofuran dehydrogenase subunit E